MAIALKLELSGMTQMLMDQFNPAAIRRAQSQASMSTARFIRSQLMASLRAQGVSLSVARKNRRFRLGRVAGGGSVLWLGTNPVPAHWLGKPRKTATGVKVRGHEFEGAFYAPARNGSWRVFRRSTKAQLPIESVMLDGFDELSQTAWSRIERHAQRHFNDALQKGLEALL